jgi:hypothetical protein
MPPKSLSLVLFNQMLVLIKQNMRITLLFQKTAVNNYDCGLNIQPDHSAVNNH